MVFCHLRLFIGAYRSSFRQLDDGPILQKPPRKRYKPVKNSWEYASVFEAASFCKFPVQKYETLIVKNKAHLEQLQKTLHLSPADYTLEKIIPIDNGNILPTKELGPEIVHSKQYDWKHLPFATLPFSDVFQRCMAHLPLDDAWVEDICQKINADPHIKSMSADIGGVFINSESIAQMKLRVKKLKKSVLDTIKTPKQLAGEERLAGKE